MTNRSITMGGVLRYSLLPAVLPRMRDLFGSGFGSFAFFIALVYRAVRLLPDGHPFLNPANLGRFGVAAVIAEAFRYIKFNRFTLGQRNLDQWIVFVVVLAAIVILILQFITLALAVVMPSAMAFSFPGGANFPTPFHMFQTPVIRGNTIGNNPQNFYDLSFMFLDRVFGVPGVFQSCIADTAKSCVPVGSMYGAEAGMRVNDPPQFPWPYHTALHQIFQFYSIGLLVVAIFLLIYFTIVVVAETAQTGTPFGKRFNTLWAPLRLVTAAGLLIPLSYGLNAGQYLVLYSAKWGANFASNGWIGFNQTLVRANVGGTGTIAGDRNALIARPGRPDATELVHFISVMHACKDIQDNYMAAHNRRIQMDDRDISAATLPWIRPFLVRSAGIGAQRETFKELTDSITYDQAVVWSNYGDVVIRFGIQDSQLFKDHRGSVKPYCGELTIPTVVNPAQIGGGTLASSTQPAFYHQGAAIIMFNYWTLLKELILKRDANQGYIEFDDGTGATVPALNRNINQALSRYYYQLYMEQKLSAPQSPQAYMGEVGGYVTGWINESIRLGQERERMNASNPYGIPADLLVRGWAGAGIWYNRIADMNGTFTTAAFNLPKVSMYPMTMEWLANEKTKGQEAVSPSQVFSPYVQDLKVPLAFPGGALEERAADTYWQITSAWQENGGLNASSRTLKTGNVIIDMINVIFGTSGLFSIRQNANVHPLAQLSSIGKSLIERTITLLGVGLAGTAIQPWIPENLAGMRAAMGVVSGFAFSILSIGAAAGFILFYIIPFLPFMYFFFAVAGWVKAIFEAMVGVPLWALAHIRIDGDGLPGEAAVSGYFLILEIMIRPILIVFGLIASVTIYAASVHVLNDVFNLAVANVGGVDMDATLSNPAITLENLRGSIDTLFYTIMYVILVYMLGMSCFKLIDLIPGSMLRWIGSNANAFTDSGEQAAGQLVSYGTIGSNMIFGQLSGAARQGVQGISQMGTAMKDMASKPGG
jgi:conjugal transfer/type IV secretion protein DotA/TraY